MNRPLQHDEPRAALVSFPVDAVCKIGNVDEQRLVSIAEQMPVAFRYNGFAHAVMMASPRDLEDFAVGFSRSEGIAETSADLQEISILQRDDGIAIDEWPMKP